MEEIEAHEQSAHASKLRVGGWPDVLYQNRNSKNYNQIINPHHLYLFFDAQLNDKWRAYTDIEFEHVPSLEGGGGGEGEIKIERVYIEHNQTDLLNTRVGKFNTPLGLWTVEHWTINVLSVQKPIHEDNKYVPLFQVGLKGFGHWISPSRGQWAPEIQYAIWMSTGNDISGTDNPSDNKFAYGANTSVTFPEKLKLGLTGYAQSNPAATGRQEKTLLPYAELYITEELTLLGEDFHQSRDMGSTDI